jgi:hypothetical protein
MLPAPKAYQMAIWEGASPTLLAYVEDAAAIAILQAGCSSIAYAIYNTGTTPPTSVATGSLTVSAVIFNALQTGYGWPYATGFNFKWKVLGTLIPGVKTFRVEVVITAAGADADKIPLDPWEIEAQEIYSLP